jgi:hypothetical protein
MLDRCVRAPFVYPTSRRQGTSCGARPQASGAVQPLPGAQPLRYYVRLSLSLGPERRAGGSVHPQVREGRPLHVRPEESVNAPAPHQEVHQLIATPQTVNNKLKNLFVPELDKINKLFRNSTKYLFFPVDYSPEQLASVHSQTAQLPMSISSSLGDD